MAQEVKVVVRRALAREVTEHVGDAVVGIARGEPPHRFEARAEARLVKAGLAAEEGEPEPEVARREAGELLGDGALQSGGVRGRAMDRGNLEVQDRAHQQRTVSHAEGDHRRARRLQGEVVAHAPHPHLIVEAMDRECAGRQPRGAEGAGADLGRLCRIGLGLGDVHRLAGGAGGAVQADDALGRGREIIAEGRMRSLGLPQHPLIAEREGWQILQPLRHPLAGPKPGQEGRSLDDVGSLDAPALLPQRRDVVR